MTTSPRSFIRHYLEMVAAMFAGMLVLGIPAEALLRALGTSSTGLEADAPALMFLEMGVIMTIPMVALMRRRGHAWRPCWEMAASMLVPTFAAIGLLAAGVGGAGRLMAIEHAVMLVAMLGVMLARYDEYAACGHGLRRAVA